jgi:hypothetical protein
MPRRRGKLAKTARLAALLGAVAAAGAAVFKRDKVAQVLPFGGGEERASEPGPAPAPGPSNYDAPGPVANTATAVPVPPAHEPPTVDEAAEEAAAAAEAANIGGQVSDYASPETPDAKAPEEMRPLMEAGEGESEGQEQAEAELAAAAEPTAPGASPEQHQIEDAIEAAGNPTTPETVEPLAPAEHEAEGSIDRPAEPAGSGGAAGPGGPEGAEGARGEAGGEASGRDREPPGETGAAPDDAAPAEPAAEEKPPDEDEGAEWRTWSGRSVNP